MAENPEPETTPVRSKGVLPFSGTALSGILSLKLFSFSRKRGTDLEEPCTTESTAKRSRRNSSSTEESQSPPRAAKITRQETPNPTSTSVTLRPKSVLTKRADDPKKQPPPQVHPNHHHRRRNQLHRQSLHRKHQLPPTHMLQSAVIARLFQHVPPCVVRAIGTAKTAPPALPLYARRIGVGAAR